MAALETQLPLEIHQFCTKPWLWEVAQRDRIVLEELVVVVVVVLLLLLPVVLVLLTSPGNTGTPTHPPTHPPTTTTPSTTERGPWRGEGEHRMLSQRYTHTHTIPPSLYSNWTSKIKQPPISINRWWCHAFLSYAIYSLVVEPAIWKQIIPSVFQFFKYDRHGHSWMLFQDQSYGTSKQVSIYTETTQ